MIAFASSLDQAGVITRSAEDAALLLGVMAGFDKRDSTSIDHPVPDYLAGLGQSLKGLRVGIVRQHFDAGLDEATGNAVREALSVLEAQGASLTEVDLPNLDLSVPTYYVVAPAECSSNLSRFDGVRFGHRAQNPEDLLDLYCRSRGEGFGAEVKRRILTGTYVLSAGYYEQQVRQLIADDFRKAFADVDVIAGPTAPAPAFRLGDKTDDPITMYLNDIYTIGANLAGLPGISIPCGFAQASFPSACIWWARISAKSRYCVPRTSTSCRPTGTRVARRVTHECRVGSRHRAGDPYAARNAEQDLLRCFHRLRCGAIDLGYPGVLPVLNEEVVHMACKFGLAVNATVAPRSVFARKNYFYPDLPKGYQISQYELPIVEHGELFITDDEGNDKRIGITRAHLEEDAGKSVHEGLDRYSGIDLNRAGTPLLEIVSEPDLRSAKEAVAYMRKIHTIVRYLGISDGNMQEGSFRCDANVSVRPRGDAAFGTRTEIKNLNSFRFVERAINFEIERQIDVLEDGGEVVQETRLYDSGKDETRSMRSKEEANDYRYFPDPDLLPVEISREFIDSVRETLPELPDDKRHRFVDDYGIKQDDAAILVINKATADYFEAASASADAPAQVVANWVIGDLSGALNKEGLEIEACRIPAQDLAGLINRIHDNTISGKIAKEVFEAMWAGEGTADEVIEARGLKRG
jgi:aspartyl-tRNA(Asn)/glutamyl-tRNA(Gln) amidotransferase subunit B